MSGDVSNRKRLISITGGNLRNGHIYLSGHHDFFPKECYGQSGRAKGLGKPLILLPEGTDESIETDISTNGKNGKPRNFFRKRGWVKKFFKKYDIREGDVVAIEKVSKYKYRVYPFETKSIREGAFVPEHWPKPNPKKPSVIDLFAGCGGFSYGLKQAGFENLLAVEWDSSCYQTFKQNIGSRILHWAIQG